MIIIFWTFSEIKDPLPVDREFQVSLEEFKTRKKLYLGPTLFCADYCWYVINELNQNLVKLFLNIFVLSRSLTVNPSSSNRSSYDLKLECLLSKEVFDVSKASFKGTLTVSSTCRPKVSRSFNRISAVTISDFIKEKVWTAAPSIASILFKCLKNGEHI